MQGSRLRAFVQPGAVLCLLGAAAEAAPLSLQTHIALSSSSERIAGVASPSSKPPITGSFAPSFASSSKAKRGSKDRRGGTEFKEDESRLIRVVLRKDLKGLGRQGEVVLVKRGRMRHMLYPAGEAAYATPDNLAKYALADAELRSRDSGSQEGVLEKLLRALGRKSVIVTRCASRRDPERFVGPTVSPDSIRKAVLRQLGIQLDPSHFLSDTEIKMYGTFKIPLNLRLPDDQQIELTVHVDRRGGTDAGGGGGGPAAAAVGRTA